MIHQPLHRDPVGVDREALRHTKLRVGQPDFSYCSHLNSIFVAATEFGDACLDFPVVFVNAGKNEKGQTEVAPIAVLGVTGAQNLFVEGSGDAQSWRARYMPAVLRTYPFCTTRMNDEQFAICIDRSWHRVNTSDGQALFGDDGQPSEVLKSARQQLEVLEVEIARTRTLGQRLLELDLLRDMRFDATLPDGRKHSVDGFLTVEQKRVTELPDATVLELHKQGLLGLIHAHWLSLGNMRKLLDWHFERNPAVTPMEPTPPTAGEFTAPATPAANA